MKKLFTIILGLFFLTIFTTAVPVEQDEPVDFEVSTSDEKQLSYEEWIIKVYGKAVPLNPPREPRERLPQLSIDRSQTTVSGLSSGAYMAVQLHFALSATFRTGAGVFAGGPYYCAQGNAVSAPFSCMQGIGNIPINDLVQNARNWAAQGLIDSTNNIASSKIYLFSGRSDSIVAQRVMDQLNIFYNNFASNIRYNKASDAGHAFITNHYGGFCSSNLPPFINNCGFDSIGQTLEHLYGSLNPRNNNPSGSLIAFNQLDFIFAQGMADTGYVYVPASCQGANARCRLHVALHGCMQSLITMGQTFVANAGYNMWADTNKLVILYPQTGYTAPGGCWDWIGYTGQNYAQRSGIQINAIKKMIDHVTAGF